MTNRLTSSLWKPWISMHFISKWWCFLHHLDCGWNGWKMIPGTWFDLFLPDQTPSVVWREAKMYERFTKFQICQFKPNCRDFYLLILVGNDWVPSDFWLLSISAQSVTLKFPLMRQKVGNQTQTINRTKASGEKRGSFERLQKPQFWQNLAVAFWRRWKKSRLRQ